MSSLHQEIEQLIARARADLALQPLNQDISKRIKALTDLQSILLHQELPQDELMTIRRQIAQISATSISAPRTTTLPVHSAATVIPTPTVAPAPVATPVPTVPIVPTPPPIQPQAAAPSLTQQGLQALLNPGTLAELLRASTARGNQTPTPTAQPIPPPSAPPSMSQSASVASQGAASSLIASLRAKGLLPPVSNPSAPPAQISSLPLVLPGQGAPAASAPPLFSITTIDVPLNSSSVKT